MSCKVIPEKERYENLEKFTPLVTGKYDIPVIGADEVIYSDFIGFNYANTAKDRADTDVVKWVEYSDIEAVS